MNFFRKSKKIAFDDGVEVEIYELSVASLGKLANGEYNDDFAIIVDNSSLSEADLQKMCPEAMDAIVKAFRELNEAYFGDGEPMNKKK